MELSCLKHFTGLLYLEWIGLLYPVVYKAMSDRVWPLLPHWLYLVRLSLNSLLSRCTSLLSGLSVYQTLSYFSLYTCNSFFLENLTPGWHLVSVSYVRSIQFIWSLLHTQLFSPVSLWPFLLVLYNYLLAVYFPFIHLHTLPPENVNSVDT